MHVSDQAIEQDRWPVFKLAAVGLIALHLAATTVILLQPAWGLDERHHVSYALGLLQERALFLDFHTARVIAEDLSGWAGPMTVNHPPPYYWLMAAVAWPFEGWPAQILAMRVANVGLSLAAVLAAVVMARRLPGRAAPQVAFLALIVLSPWLPLLGGRVNNDNLAILGGLVFALGAWSLLSGQRDGRAWGLTALGILLAGTAKATAAFLVGLAAAPLLLLLVIRDATLLRRPALWLVVLCGVLSLLPYAVLQIRYGSPVPTVPAALREVLAYAAEMGWNERYGPLRYLRHFSYRLFVNIHPTAGGASYDGWPAAVQWQAVLALVGALLALQAASLAASARRLIRDPAAAGPMDWLLVIGAFGLLGTVALNLAFMYRAHLSNGWLNGVWARYYLPAVFVPAGAVWSLLAGLPRRWVSAGASWLVITALLLSYLAAW